MGDSFLLTLVQPSTLSCQTDTHSKLHKLGLNTALCNWILDFLTHRTQHVRIGKHVSLTLPMNTGVPQGCVLSPLLYTLFTHDCCSSSPSTLIVKYADDTTIRGLFTGNDNTSYRREAERLGEWCGDHNLVLNTTKTKEVIIDFRRARKQQPLSTPNRRGGGREGVQLQVSGRDCGRRSVLEDRHHLCRG